MATLQNTNSDDFNNAFNMFVKKRPALDTLYKYVNGPQPLKYSTERLKEIFEKIRVHFEVNWCNVIVQTSLDRLSLNGFDVSEKKQSNVGRILNGLLKLIGVDAKTADDANTKLDTIFDKLHIDLEADKAHKGALTFEYAYIMVWKNSKGETEVYYNDPRICHVFYSSSNPNEKRYAAKWFRRDDKAHEIILYYPDRLEHYISRSKKDDITSPNDFELQTPVEQNTYGVIPVFELKTEGEVINVLTEQDAINMVFADFISSVEFDSFKQKYVISQADPGNLKNGVNQVWWIPSGDGQGQQASVGEFSSGDMTKFMDSLDRIATYMFSQTRTPKHYALMDTSSNISGEALITMEAPLVKKVYKHQRRLNPTWQDIGQFILQLEGVKVDASVITPVWERVETVQPFTEAQTNQILINTGIPLETILRREGWTEQELADLKDDIQNERTSRRTIAQETLANLRTQDAQNNQAPTQAGNNQVTQ